MRGAFMSVFVAIFLGALIAAALAGCARPGEERSTLDDAEAAALRDDCTFGAGERAGMTLARTAPLDDALPFDTIVVVLLQGRSFDHLLGTMAGDVDVRAPVGGHATRYCVPAAGDDWKASHVAFAGGANDGFAQAAASDEDPTGARVMQSYGADDLPVLHALASRYAVSDRHFAGMLADADANRALLYSGTTHGRIDASATTPASVVGAPSLFELLDAAGVSWRVYTEGDGPAALAGVRARHGDRFGGGFGVDARAGTLPHVAFVEVAPPSRGGGRFDFRAPGDVQLGDRFLSEMYTAVTASPQWPRMAVLVTFLDSGGFYDHVVPPAACRPDAWGPGPGRDDLPLTFDRDGFRVPLVVVSPWARMGAVSHAITDHASLARLIEARFGLPALSARDANANPLYDLFDFTSPPRSAPAMPAPQLDSDELDRCMDTYL
jgi:phospholipase C